MRDLEVLSIWSNHIDKTSEETTAAANAPVGAAEAAEAAETEGEDDVDRRVQPVLADVKFNKCWQASAEAAAEAAAG